MQKIKTLLFLVVVLAGIGASAYVYVTHSRQNAAKTTNDQTLEAHTDFYTIKAVIPNEPLDTQKEMQQYITARVDNLKEEWKIGGESYVAEQEVAKDFPDRPKQVYEADITYTRSESQKLGTVSYILSEYTFEGGAHGNTKLTTFTFGKNGKIALEDVLRFQDDQDIQLAKLMRPKLIATLGEYADESMIDTGLGLAFLKPDGTFDSEKCHCDGFFFPSTMQNFTLTDTGMTFTFDRYEVAPYVVGNPSIDFTWHELAPFMNPNFSLPLE